MPILPAMARALASFNRDDGWAIASHIALSGVMALFPFLIFCAALAAFFNLGQLPQDMADLIFEVWPESVAGPLAGHVQEVLTVQRTDLLTVGAALALLFASNGVEALRLGLNRAYGANETRGFLALRLQSLAFVAIAAISVGTVTFLLVLAPLGLDLAARYLPAIHKALPSIDGWRYVVSAIVLLCAVASAHKWLPSGKRRNADIWPGIVLTLLFWFAAAIGFGWYLRGFADYVSTYASLAGIMIALVFIYLMSAIFLLGASFNATLAKRRTNSSGEDY